ncbi:MAG: cob(I)yrinic acid a,c-diamide adenosyltransferase [Treponema sp.]|nr:cob(I)yrinic acid a,c-diamide adenosyltransferase [Treponema sp.]
MSVVTKTGDDGYTDIIGGERLRKDHPAIECMGTIDELTAFLGDAKAALRIRDNGSEDSADIITGIQKDLFLLMGILAGMPVPEKGICEDHIAGLIEELESKLPPSNSFAIPGANPASAKLHIARTVCRRAERQLIGFGLDEKIRAAIVPYINRLSDLLFLLAQDTQD